MNTFTSKLNKKVMALSAEHPMETAALRYLSLIVLVLLCAYLYFVSATVLNVIAQREASRASASLESDIGQLEQRYFMLAEGLTEDTAIALGLEPIVARSYVYRPGTVGSASVSRNAI
jgi:hypothetical protein